MHATPRDWALLIALGVIWGASFMATKLATEALPPMSVAAGRLTLATLTLGAILHLKGGRLPGWSGREDRLFWLAALGVAFLSNAMPFTALAWAQTHVESALAGVFMTTVPLFVLPLGYLFVPGELLSWRRVAGFVLGFSGVLVLLGPTALSGIGSGPPTALLAQGACLLAAFGYASGGIVAKRAPQRGLLPFALAGMSLATILTVPLALWHDGAVLAWPDPVAGAALVYLGLLPTALATLMLLAVIRSAGPGFLSLVNYQVPVWAVVFGTLLLGEAASPRLGVALALILAGLAVAQVRLGLRRGAQPRG